MHTGSIREPTEVISGGCNMEKKNLAVRFASNVMIVDVWEGEVLWDQSVTESDSVVSFGDQSETGSTLTTSFEDQSETRSNFSISSEEQTETGNDSTGYHLTVPFKFKHVAALPDEKQLNAIAHVPVCISVYFYSS